MRFLKSIEEHRSVVDRVLNDSALLDQLKVVLQKCLDALKNGNKLLIAGNGGSAADAQHFAAELVGRFLVDRKALPAVALTVDSSALTAIGNDYGFEQIFSRQVEALGSGGDVLFLISTSGNSTNLLRAAEAARQKGVTTVGLTGESGGKLKGLVDHCLCVPSSHTPRIQEMHLLLEHVICDELEQAYVP